MVSRSKSNGLPHDLSDVICFLWCNLCAADIFKTVKPPTSGLSRYLVVIIAVINTHTLTKLHLKFFSNIHQRSKAHFLVITHKRANAILEVNLNKQ